MCSEMWGDLQQKTSITLKVETWVWSLASTYLYIKKKEHYSSHHLPSDFKSNLNSDFIPHLSIILCYVIPIVHTKQEFTQTDMIIIHNPFRLELVLRQRPIHAGGFRVYISLKCVECKQLKRPRCEVNSEPCTINIPHNEMLNRPLDKNERPM